MTSGEMLVGPAKLMLLDEISTGLDSSTTFTIMSMMRRYVHIMHGTILCGLLQPQPETFELFDEVVLISAGKVGLGQTDGVVCCPVVGALQYKVALLRSLIMPAVNAPFAAALVVICCEGRSCKIWVCVA